MHGNQIIQMLDHLEERDLIKAKVEDGFKDEIYSVKIRNEPNFWK